MGPKAAFWGCYTSKSALQTQKEPLAQAVLGLLWSEQPKRQDLLQFRPADGFEPSLTDEFFYFLVAEGSGWHGSCCFPPR